MCNVIICQQRNNPITNYQDFSQWSDSAVLTGLLLVLGLFVFLVKKKIYIL